MHERMNLRLFRISHLSWTLFTVPESTLVVLGGQRNLLYSLLWRTSEVFQREVESPFSRVALIDEVFWRLTVPPTSVGLRAFIWWYWQVTFRPRLTSSDNCSNWIWWHIFYSTHFFFLLVLSVFDFEHKYINFILLSQYRANNSLLISLSHSGCQGLSQSTFHNSHTDGWLTSLMD